MNALVIDRIGGPEVYRIADMPVPEPGYGEVQCRVVAAGMNPVDWKIREGLFPVPKMTFPYISLREFSGTVTEVGRGVIELKVGDEVYGIAEEGAAAEFTIAKVNAIAIRPKSLHAVDAAVVPLAGMTAWQALFTHGGLRPGQRVLIHAASGGVGTYAVQLAKWAGAYVIGTCGPGHIDAVKRLGADEVVDYTKKPFQEVIKPVDLILHSIGQEEVAASLQVLKTGGILVSISADPMELEAANQDKFAMRFMMQPNNNELSRLSELIDSGTIHPVIDAIVPMAEASDAMATLQRGHTYGKLGVRII